jgi:long-chain acyl-CoA synthetase
MKAVSKEIGGELTDKETPIRRNIAMADALVTQPFEGIETVTDVLHYAARTWGTKNALGTRPVIKVVEEEKEMKKMVDGKQVKEMKKWKYLELGKYEYLSFKQVEEKVNVLAKAWLSLGLKTGEVFNVYAQTRYEPNSFVFGSTSDSLAPTARTGNSFSTRYCHSHSSLRLHTTLSESLV